MHTLIPHFIQENYARGVHQGEFRALGLFIDISGFSAMTDALMKHGPHGAETLAAVMRGVFAPLFESVFSQGGFIATTAGDAFTALFPCDQPGPPAELRALAAAWQMQQHVAAIRRQPTPYGDFTIRAKVGLGAGQAGWGIVASKDQRRAAYYFQGSAVDRCAAAEHQAQAGEIILDGELYPALQAAVSVEPRGEHYLLAAVAADLPAAQPIRLPPGDPEIMARFFPAAILAQSHSGEFRQVVNLFIGLPTVRNETQLTAFMHSLFELLNRYGGLFKTLDFGDKGSNVLLFWGTPAAYEDDVERALNVIIDLRTLTSIPINAGVTYQIAHAGFIGSPLMEDFSCYGRGVNLAARFMTTAPRGEIWVDEPVFRRARGKFEFDFEAEMSFKGFAQPQPVYVLHERKETAEAFFAGPWIGRQAELEQLQAFVAPQWQGRPAGALVIWGEAGLGKSRLVHEFQASSVFTSHPAQWAVCQCDGILRESLNPFRYWLRRFFDQSEGHTEAHNKRYFNRAIDRLIAATPRHALDLADELDRTRSFLGALVGLHWPDSLYEQLDPEGRFENTLIALSVLLRAESLQNPLIVFLDDAHWLDDDTRLFLPRLVRTLSSDGQRLYPVTIIAAARREAPVPLLGAGLEFQEISLGSLPPDGLAQLGASLLEGPLSPGLLALLAERAEGNPFFAEQILYYLKDARLLELGAEGWRLSGRLEQSPLPGDVRALLVARLDRLTVQVRQVVQTASVLGREFEVPLLARLLQADESLFQRVSEAAQASIWTALDELHYIFKHLLLQEAAYRMLVVSRRQALHGMVVEAIESLHADHLPAHYRQLAYHSDQAGQPARACRYWEQAGDAARSAYQISQAIADYTRALSLTPPGEFAARFRLLAARQEMYAWQGNRLAQLQDLRELETLILGEDEAAAAESGPQHQARLWELRASYALEAGEYVRVADYAQRAIGLAHQAQALQTAIEAHNSWALALLRQARPAAAAGQALEGLRLARQIGNQHSECLLVNMLGLIAVEQADYPKAREHFQRSLELARRTGSRRYEAMVFNNLGMLSDDMIQARDASLQGLQICREIGFRVREGVLLGNLGWQAGALGDYSLARANCEQALVIARESGDRPSETTTLLNLSAFAELQGDLPAALAYARQGLELACQMGETSTEAWAHTYLGHALLGCADYEAAAAAYQAALEIRRRLDQPGLAAEVQAGLARLALARNLPAEALAQVNPILEYLKNGGALSGADQPLRVYLSCYQALQANSDRRAGEILAEARRRLQDQAARISDEAARRAFLQDVPFHRLILAARAAP